MPEQRPHFVDRRGAQFVGAQRLSSTCGSKCRIPCADVIANTLTFRVRSVGIDAEFGRQARRSVFRLPHLSSNYGSNGWTHRAENSLLVAASRSRFRPRRVELGARFCGWAQQLGNRPPHLSTTAGLDIDPFRTHCSVVSSRGFF